MSYRYLCPFLAALFLIAAACAVAQPIRVTVDNQEVAFVGEQPQMVDGRVLVPFRGVLEKTGATVSWDASARQVTAKKGERTVLLTIGNTNAMVNGQTVVMDVPAAIMAGTTMVPLRFVGEALGSKVSWVPETRTVQIMTTTPPATAAL